MRLIILLINFSKFKAILGLYNILKVNSLTKFAKLPSKTQSFALQYIPDWLAKHIFLESNQAWQNIVSIFFRKSMLLSVIVQ